MSFAKFNFNSHIQSALEAQKFTEPTPIQEQALPHVLAGRDIMGIAQTGTGKTAAFVLPMIERFSQVRSGRIRGLVIAPTRELADQIAETVRFFGRSLGIRCMSAYGGASLFRQIESLKRGVDIVVACPGRLLDHMERGTIDVSDVEMLVLDEADRMFDMGFLPVIRRILQRLPKQRQTALFSATMPQDITKLARDILQDPVSVKVGDGALTTSVSHAIYPVSQHLKTALLIKLLREIDTESVLVFVRTKHRARRVAQSLEDNKFCVTSLQGNLSQSRRVAAMQGFRSGEFQIMVATDIAARGIDVSSISHVINYDMPDTTEAYTHRIGRTGRAARTGDALTLVCSEDHEMLRSIERVLKAPIEKRRLPDFDYRAGQNDESRAEFARPALRSGAAGSRAGMRRGRPSRRVAGRSPGARGRMREKRAFVGDRIVYERHSGNGPRRYASNW